MGRRWSDCQNCAGIRMCESTWTTILETFQQGWVILAQQIAELIRDLLPVPDGILLRTREHSDRLGRAERRVLGAAY